MARNTIEHLVLSSLVVGLLAGCSLEPVDMAPENPYRDGFELANVTPFSSQIPGGALVDVWVTQDVANDYAKVLLDGAGSGVELPVGTVIIREVLDDAGEIAKLTLMIKNEPGYFPGGGDWWYGVADPDGMIQNDENGLPIMGALEQCNACHKSRAADGYLFGIPSAYH